MNDAHIRLLVTIVVFAALLCLQVFLSNRKSRWPGFILPAIPLAYSLLTMLAVVRYDGMSEWDVLGAMLSAFLLANIPTAIFLAVYAIYRARLRRQNQGGEAKHDR